MNGLTLKVRVAALVCLLLFMWVSPWSYAENITKPYFNSFSIDDGLSQVSVTDITEDKYGYIWLATQAGLDRFDGYTFRHFGKWTNDPTDGLHSLTVFQIESSIDGEYIWIGTIAGVSRFNVDTETFEHFELPVSDTISAGAIKRIVVDDNANVWVISGRSLYQFSSENYTFELITTLTDTTSTLTDIIIDHQDNVWLSSTSGLYQLAPNHNTLTLAGYNGVNISVMMLAPDNNIWLGTTSLGLCLYTSESLASQTSSQCIAKKNGLSGNVIITLMQQKNGSIWVATETGLNIIHDPNQFNRVTQIPAVQTNLADNRVASLYQTSENIIVAGTRDAGFSVYNPNLASFSTNPVGTSTTITGLSNGQDDTVWITADKNLWRYNHKTSKAEGPYVLTTNVNGSMSSNKLLSVHYDKQVNTVWIATHIGLAMYKPRTDKVELVGLTGKSGYSINSDEVGDVWYGGYSDGVFVYRPTNHTVVRQWPIPLTTRIVLHNSESAWLATVSGLYFADKRTGDLTNIANHLDTFPSNAVITWISRSTHGGFWVATQANGIFYLTIEGDDLSSIKIKQIKPDSLLSSLSLGAIIEDDDNGLWISTSEGLAYIKSPETDIAYFGEQNGVSGKGYYIGAAVKSSDGTIMMGSPIGLTQFTPKNIQQLPWEPKVHLTSIDVVSHTSHWAQNGSYYANIDELKLTPDDISFSIEFAALDYTNPHEVRYAYKLSNFDQKWRHTNYLRRIATYTNLDAGRYTLTVKAMNKAGQWSPHEAHLVISVTPPWWEKTSWRIVIVVFIIVVISLAIWWRISALKRHSERLSAMIEEKTHDLEEAVEKLTQLSNQDPLTGLKNRRYFIERAQDAWAHYQRYSTPFSLMLVDIDWFKQYNDTYGHHVGDLILVKFAKILNNNLRTTDVIARWGGEEFLILLPELNVNDSYKVAEKLRTTIANTQFICDGNELTVTITAGVADISECDSLDQCIKVVDKKLYRGKAAGRNAVIK